MKEKVYVIPFSDGMNSGAQRFLNGLGAITIAASIHPFELDLHDGKLVIGVFVADHGHFPSKHIRMLDSLSHARQKNFSVPADLQKLLAEKPAKLIAIKAAVCRTQPLYEALCSAHLRDEDGAWTGPKQKRASRLGRLAERRQERREQYALP